MQKVIVAVQKTIITVQKTIITVQANVLVNVLANALMAFQHQQLAPRNNLKAPTTTIVAIVDQNNNHQRREHLRVDVEREYIVIIESEIVIKVKCCLSTVVEVEDR